MKTCTRCGIEKPHEEFSRRSRSKDGRGPWCRVCVSAYHREWYAGNHKKRTQNRTYYQENPERFREFALKKKYSLTLDEYEAIHQAQNGLCALCRKPETARDGRSGKTRRLAVDHCHETGRIRGLLCYRCNHLIGCLGDNVESMERVIRYLGKEGGAHE